MTFDWSAVLEGYRIERRKLQPGRRRACGSAGGAAFTVRRGGGGTDQAPYRPVLEE